MIREATEADLPALTALCLAAKAHWGYDAAFMAACEQELGHLPATGQPHAEAIPANIQGRSQAEFLVL